MYIVVYILLWINLYGNGQSILFQRKKCPDQVIVAPTTKKMRASDLPYSTMSKFLEDRIYRRLEIAYEEAAEKLGVPVSEVEKCPPLILRQVSCLDKGHQVH